MILTMITNINFYNSITHLLSLIGIMENNKLLKELQPEQAAETKPSSTCPMISSGELF